jgi:ribosomal protein L2
MGTVIKIDTGSITVKTPSGETTTVMIATSTKFVKGTSSVTQQDLKVGDRVVIRAKPMGDMLHATEVKIGEQTQEMVHQH